MVSPVRCTVGEIVRLFRRVNKTMREESMKKIVGLMMAVTILMSCSAVTTRTLMSDVTLTMTMAIERFG